jgi:hypothetical protein
MTCSAGCCASTGELHERIYAPYAREAVIKHVHHAAKLFQGALGGDCHPDSSSDPPKPWTSHQGPAVNVAVNENPAEPCIGLLSHMPSDQHRHRACLLLHTGSND